MGTFDQTLQTLRPGVSYSNVDGTLAHVVWPSGVTPPTQQEFDAAAALMVSGGSVGFRACITGYANNLQPCGTFPNYYVPSFNFAIWDTSKRYDTKALVWRPVVTGEAPRAVVLGAQITIMGGAAATRNPCFGVKLQKNGFQQFGTDIAAGQGFMDPGKPGWAYAQVTASADANPGDFFCAVVTASCWSAGDPPIPFPSPWAPGTFPELGFDYCAIDCNQYHSYFWGTDVQP